MSHFVLDENNNKIEAYSAQEVINVLEQAIADGSLKNVVAGQAIIDKIKCCVTGGTMRVAFVKQAKYNELKASGNLVGNCLYHITDDTTFEDMDKTLQELHEYIKGVQEGNKVPYATKADNVTRVYQVILKFNKTDTVGEVIFNWYSKNDLSKDIIAVLADILESIGDEKTQTIYGQTLISYLAELSCTGYISTSGLNNYCTVQHIWVEGGYGSYKLTLACVESDGNRYNHEITDFIEFTPIVKQIA